MTYWVIGNNVGQGIHKFYLTPIKSGIYHLISGEAKTLLKYILIHVLIHIVIICFILNKISIAYIPMYLFKKTVIYLVSH